MSDPLSIVAGIIAVAGLAFTSSKAVYELISNISDAPPAIRYLLDNIRSLNQVLSTITQIQEQCASGLNENQLTCLKHAQPVLEGCEVACGLFKSKIEGLTAHSHDGRRSFRDGMKYSFRSKSISDFQMRVVSWKGSLALVLDIAML